MKKPAIASSFIILFIVVAVLILVQAWALHQHTSQVQKIATELESLQTEKLTSEKSRQEVIGLRIKNEAQQFYWGSLLTTLAPLATTFIALLGGLVGLRRYLDAREKERLENASNDLKDILAHSANENPRLRIVGIVGLQHFFTPDKAEYHLRALSSLVATARLEKDPEVQHSLQIAAEQAVRQLNASVLQQVSWKDVALKEVDFSNQLLPHADFRDTVLENADFSGSSLQHANFVNSRLNGACFAGAKMQGVDLTYADLAGASFADADLRDAILNDSKVLRLNIRGADLRGARFEIDKMPWPLITGWREATFSDDIKKDLLAEYGPEPSGIRVAMLMWEFPPLVAGGTWTACYHFVRKLIKRGARLTIIVPWDEETIYYNPFGSDYDVDIVPLGILPPGYSSLYGSTINPYLSSYGHAAPSHEPWSPYQRSDLYSPYGYSPYSSVYDSTRQRQQIKLGTSILRVADEFKRRFVRLARNNEEFDIIHAHDWVTFSAAQSASSKLNIPWIAHFHSTELERRTRNIDKIIMRIEQNAALAASHIVTPSQTTAHVISNSYNITSNKISAIPNPVSSQEVAPSEMGDFESRTIVYTGRMTSQKGPDYFINIIKQLSSMRPDYRFHMYGSGEMKEELSSISSYPRHMGPLSWEERSRAFDNASAIVVPSRAEPFGMVILEAMQHRVPVFYPRSSGAAETLTTGVQIDPDNAEETAAVIHECLSDWNRWEDLVEAQTKEFDAYINAGHEDRLIELWDSMTTETDQKSAKQS